MTIRVPLGLRASLRPASPVRFSVIPPAGTVRSQEQVNRPMLFNDARSSSHSAHGPGDHLWIAGQAPNQMARAADGMANLRVLWRSRACDAVALPRPRRPLQIRERKGMFRVA